MSALSIFIATVDNPDDNLHALDAQLEEVEEVETLEPSSGKEERAQKWLLPTKESIFLAVHSFSKKQKIAFFALFGLCVASGVGFLLALNARFLVEVPAYGGKFSEGLVGTPRFINPVLAASDTDRDLSALVYSGLMRVSQDGTLVPDLAESYSISEDGTTYTFILKPNLVFHNGEPITSEDVKFTVEKVKDPNLRSPRRGDWDGVVVEAPDPRTVKFVLSGQYSPFLENTTLGILPAALWKNLSTEEFAGSALNMNPVGTGPYQIAETRLLQSGVPEYYIFESFDKFALEKPYIDAVQVSFYGSETDLFKDYESGKIQAIGALPPEKVDLVRQKGEQVEASPLPRVFGVFFNQTAQDIFTDKAVREALDKAVNRDTIVRNILHGQADVSGPFPPGSLGVESASTPEGGQPGEGEGTDRISLAKSILEDAGWKQDSETHVWEKTVKGEKKTLSFSLSTSDAPELKAVALSLKKDWESLGAKVEVKIFETSDLNQNIIRPRKYDALLFGEIVGREPDPYAFWHSSQRLDPGLNIALYANVKTDKILEEIREEPNLEERKKLYKSFQDEIFLDIPAVFLYSPRFLYALPEDIRHVVLPPIVYPSERFSDIYQWYIQTDKVWKFLTN